MIPIFGLTSVTRTAAGSGRGVGERSDGGAVGRNGTDEGVGGKEHAQHSPYVVEDYGNHRRSLS